MLRALRFIPLVLAMLVIGHGHFGIVQVVAWAEMVRERAPELGLKAALIEAVSGERPCDLCESLIDARRAAAQEEPGVPSGCRMHVGFIFVMWKGLGRIDAPVSGDEELRPVVGDREGDGRDMDGPPVPPPRLA